MHNDPTPTRNGPWQLLIHDADPTDPKWVVATVVELADVRPAGWAGGLDEDTVAWVAGRVRHPVELAEWRRARVWLIRAVRSR